MPARVMLLILASALFIAIWSGDQRGRATKSTAEPEAGDTGKPESSEPKTMSAHDNGHGETAWTPNTATSTTRARKPVIARRPAHSLTPRTESTETDSAGDIPLPVDLSPGEYQVVNNRGDAQRLTLTADELAERGVPHTVPRRNHYMVDADGTRWYFIRVDGPSASLVTTTPEAASPAKARPASAERCGPEAFQPGISVDWRIDEAWKSMSRSWQRISQTSSELQAMSRRIVGSNWRRTLHDLSELSYGFANQAYQHWRKWPTRLSSGDANERR